MGVRQDEVRMGARLAARSDRGVKELVQTYRALSCVVVVVIEEFNAMPGCL
jgi:hypothetical protein